MGVDDGMEIDDIDLSGRRRWWVIADYVSSMAPILIAGAEEKAEKEVDSRDGGGGGSGSGGGGG